MLELLIVVGLILLWSTFSRPLDRRGITSALFLVAAGVVVGVVWPGAAGHGVEAEDAALGAEIALALLLFSDATRLDLRSLRHQIAWPTRLLLIGLPLTLLAGIGASLLLFPGIALGSAFLLGAMLAPTDAALGRKVVTDTSVPARVRQTLDVESGLNDGLAVPLFLVALSIANAELEGAFSSAIAVNMVEQIGWGLVGGIVAGLIGGALFRLSDRRDWITSEWRQVLPLTVALLAFAVATLLGGSGFIAAFVGGSIFGRLAGPVRSTVSMLTEEAGELLASVTWIAFGALALTVAIPGLTWQILVYAILSLTVVRMVPVAIALAGRRIRLPTIAFIGWFGPRGLASLVFALLAFESGIPEQETVLTTVCVTVALSILLHGLTSVPLAAVYRRWYEAHVATHPTAEEAEHADMLRTRRQMSAARWSTAGIAGDVQPTRRLTGGADEPGPRS